MEGEEEVSMAELTQRILAGLREEIEAIRRVSIRTHIHSSLSGKAFRRGRACVCVSYSCQRPTGAKLWWIPPAPLPGDRWGWW